MITANDRYIADSLYNASTDCAKTDALREYGKGVLVGLVSGLMASGRTFEATVKIVCEIHNNCHWSTAHPIDKWCIPECWRAEFTKNLK